MTEKSPKIGRVSLPPNVRDELLIPNDLNNKDRSTNIPSFPKFLDELNDRFRRQKLGEGEDEPREDQTSHSVKQVRGNTGLNDARKRHIPSFQNVLNELNHRSSLNKGVEQSSESTEESSESISKNLSKIFQGSEPGAYESLDTTSRSGANQPIIGNVKAESDSSGSDNGGIENEEPGCGLDSDEDSKAHTCFKPTVLQSLIVLHNARITSDSSGSLTSSSEESI